MWMSRHIYASGCHSDLIVALWLRVEISKLTTEALSNLIIVVFTFGDPGVNHGLRGSASPVLTATGFVNGRWQFSTPTESTPLDRSPKNLLLVITSATPTAVPNLVQIRLRGASGQMGEI